MSNKVQFLNLHIPQLDEVNDRLNSIEAQLGDFKQVLDAIQTKEIQMDADLQAIIDQAQANTDAESAATKALNDLFAQLVAALKGTGPISAADRAALQAKVQAMKDSAAAVAAAIVADTVPPSAPPA